VDADAVVSVLRLCKDSCRIVRRAVINGNQFPVLERLVDDAVDGLLQKAAPLYTDITTLTVGSPLPVDSGAGMPAASGDCASFGTAGS
jgi:hypothetical protein